ncbi:MAG: L,D-transpeptidase [Burkholderiales bacterium]|nr:L,D-transpeptidase [Burkholderiales bacterium]
MFVSVADQELCLRLADGRLRRYPISTAVRGTGCLQGSYCTPTGKHRVRLKIGDGCPAGTVFRGRRSTGEVFTPALAASHGDRDWILSRVLWLDGLEPGHNRGGRLDTLRRFVYIHGTADEHLIGQAASHGCVRMRNSDVVELFDLVPPGTVVHIS